MTPFSSSHHPSTSSKTNEHEEEVKKLYEEMEFQMKLEQERILAEVWAFCVWNWI